MYLPVHKPLVIAFDGQDILYVNGLAMDSPVNYRGYPTTLKEGVAWPELDLPDGNTLTVSMALIGLATAPERGHRHTGEMSPNGSASWRAYNWPERSMRVESEPEGLDSRRRDILTGGREVCHGPDPAPATTATKLYGHSRSYQRQLSDFTGPSGNQSTVTHRFSRSADG